MATLTDIRTQVTAVNATGRTNLAAKGVTVAQDVDTATIMGAIATIPSGGAAPTVVTEITWDGSTEGLESHTVTIEGEEMTFYKVSDSVLPYGIMDGGDFYEYTTVAQDDDTTTGVKWGAFDGYVVVTGTFDVVSAYLNNSVCAVSGGVIVPSVGTWIKKDGGDYVKRVTVTAAE